MLIPDLLNFLFDQSDYHTMRIMSSLHKRKTAYANKYSVLPHYTYYNQIHDHHVHIKILKKDVHALHKDAICKIMTNCAEFRYIEALKYSISVGADVHWGCNYALRWSSNNGYLDIVRYLVSIGANIHAMDDFALRSSAGNNHIETTEYLISVGADVHANDDGALKWSAQNGNLEIIKYLVSKGANIHRNLKFQLEWCERYNGYNGYETIEYFKSIGIQK